MSRKKIEEALAHIFRGIGILQTEFTNRRFTIDGRLVGDIGETPELYLGFKLYPDGGHEVIFNGPGHIIFDEYRNRKGIGVNLLRFPNSRFKELSANIPHRERVPTRLSALNSSIACHSAST